MERNRRPPDVEEALSSMLWTPYHHTDSSDEEDADVAKNGNKSKASTANCMSNNNSNNNSDNSYAAPSAMAESNLYKPAIRYQSSFVSNHGRFMPKSYNSCNRQLPSYEHIEKERTFHSLTNGYGIGAGPIAACATNGIYLIPSYATCTATTTTMVHSFTDNFIEYQVKFYSLQNIINIQNTMFLSISTFSGVSVLACIKFTHKSKVVVERRSDSMNHSLFHS